MSAAPPPTVAVVDAELDQAPDDVGELHLSVDPVLGDLQPPDLELRLGPGTGAAADLVAGRIQPEAPLRVVVHAPVGPPGQESEHSTTVDIVVEPLQLQTVVGLIVGELDIEEARDRLDAERERAERAVPATVWPRNASGGHFSS